MLRKIPNKLLPNKLLSSLFSCSIVSDSLRPHGLQHTRLPCPSLSPRACSNSGPSSQRHQPTILSSVTPSPLTLIFPSIRLCSNELTFGIRWPKYWSFSISPSNEYSGLISFRSNWFDLLPVQGTLKSFPASQVESINTLALSFFMVPHTYMTTGKTTALTIWTSVGKVMSAF